MLSAASIDGADIRVVSADEHLVEPAEFWNDLLPAALPAVDRSRAPRLIGVGLEVDGEVRPAFLRFPRLAGLSDVAAGASDAVGRIAVMDAAGIDASVLFPQRAMGLFATRDPALLVRCVDVYNSWLADLCGSSNGRLHGVAILATPAAPEDARAHVQRIVDLGFTVCMLPGQPRGRSYADEALAPMWAALEDSGLVVAFHTSESPEMTGPGELGAYLAVQFQPFRKLWAHLTFSGILAAHPRLRVLFAEGGISWVPSALDHADQIHRDFAGHLVPDLSEPPSHYWHRQCYATFMDDPRGVEQIDYIGVDHVMWSSDYPHPEGTGARSRDHVQALVEQLGPVAGRAVVGHTADTVLGLAPAHP